jgi:PAB-dependent poly(A)-specific ribonuclease subunit 3
VRALTPWKRIDNGSMVTVHDVFTTRAFGDSSLLFVTDYHPCSETLAELHQSHPGHRNGHHSKNHHQHVPEQVLWSYIVQIASALKPIHSGGLAARIIHPSKILVTSKHRVRLNACGMLDVIKFDPVKVGMQRSVVTEQQDDLVQLGRLIVSLAAGNPNIASNPFQVQQALDTQVSSTYSDGLRECIGWLLAPPKPDSPAKDLDILLSEISGHAVTVLDSFMHAHDSMDDVLATSLEDGRLVRLMMKMNMVLERHEYDHAGQGSWNSETGERYYVKLFRDYVFHAVDAQGRPNADLTHILGCLSRLDAGSTEQIQLTNRDGDTVFIVSYKEVKRSLESAFNEVFGIGSGGASHHSHHGVGSGSKGRKG